MLWLPPASDRAACHRGRDAIRAFLTDVVGGRYAGGVALDHLHTLATSPAPASGEDMVRIAGQFEYRTAARDGRSREGSPVATLAIRGPEIAGLWAYRGGPSFFAASPLADWTTAEETEAVAVAGALFAELQRGLAGDSASMARFLDGLDAEVRIWFPPTPATRSPYLGIAAATRVFAQFLPALYPRGLFVRRFHTLACGPRVGFELQSFGIRRDGSEYLNSPLFCMEVRAARVTRIWEHWGAPGCFDPRLRAQTID